LESDCGTIAGCNDILLEYADIGPFADNLSGQWLVKDDLIGAKLGDANLSGADLFDAILYAARSAEPQDLLPALHPRTLPAWGPKDGTPKW
jgi:hypothetical protein